VLVVIVILTGAGRSGLALPTGEDESTVHPMHHASR
jgi:hypothetical protein